MSIKELRVRGYFTQGRFHASLQAGFSVVALLMAAVGILNGDELRHAPLSASSGTDGAMADVYNPGELQVIRPLDPSSRHVGAVCFSENRCERA